MTQGVIRAFRAQQAFSKRPAHAGPKSFALSRIAIDNLKGGAALEAMLRPSRAMRDSKT
jgi:hypothetical protein